MVLWNYIRVQSEVSRHLKGTALIYAFVSHLCFKTTYFARLRTFCAITASIRTFSCKNQDNWLRFKDMTTYIQQLQQYFKTAV